MTLQNFELEIGSVKYQLNFEKEDTMFKPLNLTITRDYELRPAWWAIPHYNSDYLEEKYYNRIRRRIYHNLVNIEKLKAGRIRQYQIFNQLELEVLAAYLCEKKILFRIYAETVYYKTLYKATDTADYNAYFCDPLNKEILPDRNKVKPLNKMYIRVYKGYHELNEAIKTIGYQKAMEYKFGIYL